jgi:hypothetical protein
VTQYHSAQCEQKDQAARRAMDVQPSVRSLPRPSSVATVCIASAVVVHFNSHEYRTLMKCSIRERKDPDQRMLTLYSSKGSLYVPGVRQPLVVIVLDFHANLLQCKGPDMVAVQRDGANTEGRVGE